MYGLTLIAVLAVMGGIIAYIGDKLGTKVGKRKLTIFGLRPRHTSILVTIVTGIIIAGLTLGVLSLASRDVRTALFGMDELKARLSGLSQEVVAKNGELEASRAELEAKTKEYSALTLKVRESAAKLAQISGELASVVQERDKTAAALAKVQRDYASARGDLDKARQEITALQTTKDELDAKVSSLNKSKTDLEKDVERLNDLTDKLRKGIQIVREGVVIYRAGEVLSVAVVKGGQSPEDAQKTLVSVINDTNQHILEKLQLKDKSLEVLWIPKADFDQTASLLAGAAEDTVVRISSLGNIVYGEPVIGRIELFPNRLIYSKGEVVLAEVVEGGNNAEDSVWGFLNRVNSKAISQGMLPDPLQGTVGTVSGAQFFESANKVKRMGGKVEISAVAKENIYTSGLLYIEIRVRSVL